MLLVFEIVSNVAVSWIGSIVSEWVGGGGVAVSEEPKVV